MFTHPFVAVYLTGNFMCCLKKPNNRRSLAIYVCVYWCMCKYEKLIQMGILFMVELFDSVKRFVFFYTMIRAILICDFPSVDTFNFWKKKKKNIYIYI